MPYITEELYEHLPIEGKAAFAMKATWPELPDWFQNEESESQVERAIEITRAIRALRAEVGIAPMKNLPEFYYDGVIDGIQQIVASQSWITRIHRSAPDESIPCIFTAVGGASGYLPLGDLMSPEQLQQEAARIRKEIEKVADDVNKLSAKLQNPMFVEKAKPEVVEKDRALLAELQEKLAQLENRVKLFSH